MSNKVYIAPSVFFSFIDRIHPKHDQAAAFFRFFAQNEYQLFSDSINLSDTYNLLYRKMSPSVAKDFLRAIEVSDINIIYPERADIRAAIKTLISYRSDNLSFTEAVMSVLASRRGISQICTFDYLHSLFGLTLFYLPI